MKVEISDLSAVVGAGSGFRFRLSLLVGGSGGDGEADIGLKTEPSLDEFFHQTRNDYGLVHPSVGMVESILDMLQSFATESPLMLAIVALAVFAVAATILRIAIRLAIRIGLVLAVVLAGIYTVGYLA